MNKVTIRPYLSPTLALLALDWVDGATRQDFLGFAILRSPGFNNANESWLPNRIGFDGPAPNGGDLPSDESPIQKFMWWDARFDDPDRGKTFQYTVTPVVGTKENHSLLTEATSSVSMKLPQSVEEGIGTYFNRAVVSSQAFIREFGEKPQGDQLIRALEWLANGLHRVIPDFLEASHDVQGAIYHLTDKIWILPALQAFTGDASLVFDAKQLKDSHGVLQPSPNQNAVDLLQAKVDFFPRTKTNIMHDKFLVRRHGGQPIAVLMGSANFTTEGLTSQANLIHTWESPELAAVYLKRKLLLEPDPSVKLTAKEAGWSQSNQTGDAVVRAFFPPEPSAKRESIDTIVEAVNGATSSVLFCLFTPTDEPLLNAIFQKGDEGKMMFGLVNSISDKDPADSAAGGPPASAKVAIFHRSRKNKDVVGHDFFKKGQQPEGFSFEASVLPGGGQFPVFIHHKFIVIDAETNHPVIYTGSANMSENSVHRNDENLMEIKECPRIAAIYLAEFLRLYEHYRARAAFNRLKGGDKKTFKLAPDFSWSKKAFKNGTPEFKARQNMAAPL